MNGLKSSHRHIYLVSTCRGNSAEYRFKTWSSPSDDVESFKIVAFSDSQGLPHRDQPHQDAEILLLTVLLKTIVVVIVPEAWLDTYNQNENLLVSSEVISHKQDRWKLKQALLNLPTTATRSVVSMRGTRNNGTDNDLYIDSVSF